jgi:hypothetical protein
VSKLRECWSVSDSYDTRARITWKFLLGARVSGFSEGLNQCCDENVIVPCSEWVKTDQNGSLASTGKRLKNHVE